MKNEYLECGQILRSHGINGGMIVKQLCDSYEVLEGIKKVYLFENGEYKRAKVKKCSPYKSDALLILDGITTPEEVTKLRLKYLYAHRDDILRDEGDFFIADLIGLEIKDAGTKQVYGILKDVINQGAQDLYVVEREGKVVGYVPAISQFVESISLEDGIAITPIEGMIE
ncbi:MAG: 16S rRNA processing protein RimM [Clostridia bacterium]|nr:16S rRNA processing protein RimM [Clostridia bacterium]